MSSPRDEFLHAYQVGDNERLLPFVKDPDADRLQLTSEATRWLLDSWDAADRAEVAAPFPPDSVRRKYVGGVDA